MTKVRNPARNMWTWRLLLGAVALALCLTAPARTIAGETGSTDEYAGVPITGSVLLDPFDPVPQIQFRRDCGDWAADAIIAIMNAERDGIASMIAVGTVGTASGNATARICPADAITISAGGVAPTSAATADGVAITIAVSEGWRCEHDCEVRARCDHECHRDERGDRCLDICYGRLVHEYEERLERSDAQSHRYDEQSHWYFEHVMDRDHHDGGFEHDHFDHDHHDRDHHEDHDHFGPPEPEGPPPGPDPYGPPGPGPGAYGPPGAGPDNGPPQGPGPAYGPAPGSGPYGPPPGPDSGPPPYGSPH